MLLSFLILPLVDCTGIEPAGPALFLNCIHSVDAARLDIGARFMSASQPISIIFHPTVRLGAKCCYRFFQTHPHQ